jgi:hypothetical protein
MPTTNWPQYFATARTIEKVARTAGLTPPRARALAEGLAAAPLARQAAQAYER